MTLYLSKSKQIVKVRGDVRWNRMVDDGLYEMGVEFEHGIPTGVLVLINHLYGKGQTAPDVRPSLKEVPMSPNAEAKVEATAFLDDIEKRVSEIFSAQKSEVEQTLVEKINREKEEAQRRIEAVNQEFAQVRGFLEEHKTVMAELQTTEEHLRGEIRGHFDRAVNYQKMMENAASLAGEELEKIGGLNQELEKVRVKAESEYANLKKNLAGYAGIVAQIPAPAVKVDGDVNWTEEIGKLRKVRDLLATLRQAGLPRDVRRFGRRRSPRKRRRAPPRPRRPRSWPPPSGSSTPKTTASVTTSSSPKAAPDDRRPGEPRGLRPRRPARLSKSPTISRTRSRSSPSPRRAETAPAPEAAGPSPEDAAVLETLARYRRTESVNNGIELGFFAAETGTVLDAARSWPPSARSSRAPASSTPS